MEVKQVKISDLKEWNRNPRKNDKAAEKLAKLIAEYGFVNPIIATPDGTVRAGHTRIKAAKKLGMETVPVIYINFDSEQKAQGFSIADNKSMEWAEWDYPELDKIFEDLKIADFDLELTGFETKELNWNDDWEHLTKRKPTAKPKPYWILIKAKPESGAIVLNQLQSQYSDLEIHGTSEEWLRK